MCLSSLGPVLVKEVRYDIASVAGTALPIISIECIVNRCHLFLLLPLDSVSHLLVLASQQVILPQDQILAAAASFLVWNRVNSASQVNLPSRIFEERELPIRIHVD